MIRLKDDYRNHLVAVNKVLHDYNKIKERVEESGVDAQKKKSFLAERKLSQATTKKVKSTNRS